MINQIKTVLFLSGLFAVFLLLGYLLGGIGGLTIGFILAFIINFVTYWYSDKIVLFMYKAKEADKETYNFVYKMLKEITQNANLPMPKLYIMNSATPNAFATGRNPEHAAVALTTGILDLLEPRELKGVLSHEISHIKNRDILISTIAAVIAGAISYIAMIARFAAIFGGGSNKDGENIFGVLILSILAPIIAMIISLAISRSREYLADATGAGLCKDPNSLADALQKLTAGNKSKPMKNANPATSHMFIVTPFSGQSFLTLFSTHPPIQKRIGKLRSMAANH